MTMTTVGLVLVFLGLSMTIYGVLELRALAAQRKEMSDSNS
ncbi:MAG: hypothetical protein WDN24_06015 [Sphingomonas sp.]